MKTQNGFTLLENKKDKEVLNSISDMSPEYKKIYEILKETMSREEIAIKANKSIEKINTLLTMMEIEGYIEQVGGDNFKRIWALPHNSFII